MDVGHLNGVNLAGVPLGKLDVCVTLASALQGQVGMPRPCHVQEEPGHGDVGVAVCSGAEDSSCVCARQTVDRPVDVSGLAQKYGCAARPVCPCLAWLTCAPEPVVPAWQQQQLYVITRSSQRCLFNALRRAGYMSCGAEAGTCLDSSALKGLRHAYRVCGLLCQACARGTWGLSPNGDPAASGLPGPVGGLPTVMETLIYPLKCLELSTFNLQARIHYHFSSSRPTNRAEHPNCLSASALKPTSTAHSFLESTLSHCHIPQLSPVSDPPAYQPISWKELGHLFISAAVAVVSDAVHPRLMTLLAHIDGENPNQAASTMMCNTVHSLINFDAQLQELFSYPSFLPHHSLGRCMDLVISNPDILHPWLCLEAKLLASQWDRVVGETLQDAWRLCPWYSQQDPTLAPPSTIACTLVDLCSIPVLQAEQTNNPALLHHVAQSIVSPVVCRFMQKALPLMDCASPPLDDLDAVTNLLHRAEALANPGCMDDDVLIQWVSVINAMLCLAHTLQDWSCRPSFISAKQHLQELTGPGDALQDLVLSAGRGCRRFCPTTNRLLCDLAVSAAYSTGCDTNPLYFEDLITQCLAYADQQAAEHTPLPVTVPLAPATPSPGPVTDVAWSLDGSLLATAGSTDMSVIIWDGLACSIPNTPLLKIPNTHSSRVLSLAFHPDGRQLVTCGDPPRCMVWMGDALWRSGTQP
eukprot:gene919-2576_t